MLLLHASDEPARRPLQGDDSPFHSGEQAVQTRLGVREEIEPWAQRVVRPFLPDEHRAFYAALPFLVVAARDRGGRPWTTLLAGPPGFASSPEPTTLAVAAEPAAGDALEGALTAGREVGVLGLEPHTRRRNRVNGTVGASESPGFALNVAQAFGNCPQHIRERRWRKAPEDRAPRAQRFRGALPPVAREWVRRADTFFIGTGHPNASCGASPAGDEHAAVGMDASHRGGPPGFVTLDERGRLVFPDYAGNNHFNTLGNLALDARAGITFVDFARGHLLQLTGRAEVDWERPDPAKYPGAQRLVVFDVQEAVLVHDALPLRFDEPAGPGLPLRVTEKVRETADVVSILFESEDGSALPRWRPGQHLPLSLSIGGNEVRRTYSLSNGPTDGRYRISVKRETHGLVSGFLHEGVAVGSSVRAGEPAGDFALDLEEIRRPVVLLAAGIGVTPLLSMLHAVVDAGVRAPVTFVLAARDAAHAPLEVELRELAAALPNVRLHVYLSRPGPGDLQAEHRRQGRVDGQLVADLGLEADSDFYLCGPSAFLADVERGLESNGVAAERIHMESFHGGV